jgi:hypothetical protein
VEERSGTVLDQIAARGLGNTIMMRFQDNHHGYMRCVVTTGPVAMGLSRCPGCGCAPDGGISTLASFVVKNGRPGAQQV